MANVPEPPTAGRKDSAGRALRGSQCQFQLYVNVPARRAELDAEVLTALPTLRGVGATQLSWLSPLAVPLFPSDKPFHEYRDGKLFRALERPELAGQWSEYWPARGPVWDGVAVARQPDGSVVGAVLVEAKAYPAEFRDVNGGTAAEGKRRELIERRLKETRSWLGVFETEERRATWSGELYQWGNRLATLRFLRTVAKPPVAAWLVNVYFVEDPTFRPTPREAWSAPLEDARKDLGLEAVEHVGHVFLPGRARAEFVAATSEAHDLISGPPASP